MNAPNLTKSELSFFEQQLRQQECSAATVEKYLHDAKQFALWLNKRPVTPQSTAEWKDSLLQAGYAPSTVNGKIAAINALFRMLKWDDCKVRALRLQRRAFREDAKELSRQEYQKLVHTAQASGKTRLAILLEAIGSTGIRVSELRYFTVEAARQGFAQISLKGKIRTILLPGKLCRKLLKYAKRQKITSGEIFLTRSGKSLSRKQIWAEMKRLCRLAGVAAGKVFPHNLRHLFARSFYHSTHDVVKLADLLGHSSLTTTRIYLISTGAEHRRELEKLGLV